MAKKPDNIERMIIACKKVDFKPVIDEIHHNVLWVPVLIVLFFAVGSLFEILWMIARDIRRFIFRLFRWPRRKVRDFGIFVRHKLKKRYGEKARNEKKYGKK